MPGMIDAHVHHAFGKPDESYWNMVKDDRELLTLLAARNAQRALVQGITTLGDCGGVRNVTLNIKKAIDRVRWNNGKNLSKFKKISNYVTPNSTYR